MPSSSRIFFDDFNYRDSADSLLAQRGWTVRSGVGGPGVVGARWTPAALTFPGTHGLRVLQLESSTDGTATGTIHAQIAQRRRFREGTYAARVLFAGVPAYGSTGDKVVQAFYTITPLSDDLDPNYGELDFEYLPNGGWGEPDQVLFATSWETQASNTSTTVRGDFAGWHRLLLQVADNRIRYFVDGRLVAEHREPYYPETDMSINFNQWFIPAGLLSSSKPRAYRQQIDYVYFSANRLLTTDEVDAEVRRYRADAVTHVDSLGG